MKQGTKIFFDNLSTIYDARYIKKYFKNNHIWIFKNINNLDGMNILDIGCGTGELVIEIKKLYPKSKVIGVDIAKGMIEKAQEKAKKIDCIDFLIGDVHKLDFEKNMFDFVFNTISFHHYQEPAKALNEMKRVLKPGGKLYILDSIKDPRLISFMPWYWDYTDSKICYSRHLFSKEFHKFFENAGFKDVFFLKYYKLFPVVHILCIAEK